MNSAVRHILDRCHVEGAERPNMVRSDPNADKRVEECFREGDINGCTQVVIELGQEKTVNLRRGPYA